MSNIRIGHMTLGIYQTNCYFVYRENSDKVLVFDPADHGEKIEEALGQHGLHTAAILLTHGHFDHIGGCGSIIFSRRSKASFSVLSLSAAITGAYVP